MGPRSESRQSADSSVPAKFSIQLPIAHENHGGAPAGAGVGHIGSGQVGDQAFGFGQGKALACPDTAAWQAARTTAFGGLPLRSPLARPPASSWVAIWPRTEAAEAFPRIPGMRVHDIAVTTKFGQPETHVREQGWLFCTQRDSAGDSSTVSGTSRPWDDIW